MMVKSMISFNNALDDARYELNNLSNDITINLIKEFCDSNMDDFKLLHTPKFIINNGENAVMINNGNAKFLCVVDKKGYIIKYHYSLGNNKSGKSRYHQHDRKNWDWATCLRDICRTHTPYPNEKKSSKKNMWDKLNDYNKNHN